MELSFGLERWFAGFSGARSYMDPEELAELGISIQFIKGYGDTAVAQCAVALMWAGARGFARMDREMRAGNWLRTDGVQFTNAGERDAVHSLSFPDTRGQQQPHRGGAGLLPPDRSDGALRAYP